MFLACSQFAPGSLYVNPHQQSYYIPFTLFRRSYPQKCPVQMWVFSRQPRPKQRPRKKIPLHLKENISANSAQAPSTEASTEAGTNALVSLSTLGLESAYGLFALSYYNQLKASFLPPTFIRSCHWPCLAIINTASPFRLWPSHFVVLRRAQQPRQCRWLALKMLLLLFPLQYSY